MFALVILPKCQKQIRKLCAHDSKLEDTLNTDLRTIQENPFKAGRKLQGYPDYIHRHIGYRHALVYRVIDKAIIVFEFNTRENISYA